METDHQRWQRLTRAIAGEHLPCAVVDLDAMESNAAVLNGIARTHGKRLRLASKSIRVPALLRRLLDLGEGTLQGLMTYAASEAAFLFEQGFDDLLVAYPSAQPSDAETLAELTDKGALVSIVVDSAEQIEVLAAAARARGVQTRVIVEVDTSWRPGAGVHLGGRRSPLHDASSVLRIADLVRDTDGVTFHGVMGYEGHIAGVTDDNPFSAALNLPKRLLKKVFRGPVAQTRADVARVLTEAGHTLTVFNGGGTGSLHWASQEDVLTEVTAGSGYICSHLFSYYEAFDFTPAVFFALQVVRRPGEGMVTCHGGGYVASGESGLDRLPVPYLPPGGKLLGVEGAGEVQTPIVLGPGISMKPGDPYFFRHAKAGELAEHFNEYLLVRGEQVVDRVRTYRGFGQCFLG